MTSDTPRKYSLFPKPLSDCVGTLIRPVFKERGSAATRLMLQWKSIAGTELARHTTVEKLSFPKGKKNGGTLTVSVENGFATEFQHMQSTILERLAEYFGYRAVTRLAISNTFLPTAPADNIVIKSNPPLPSDCVLFTENIKDDELKVALQSLAKTLSGQRA